MEDLPKIFVIRFCYRSINKSRYLSNGFPYGVGLAHATLYDEEEAFLMFVTLREQGFTPSIRNFEDERREVHLAICKARNELIEANAKYNSIQLVQE
jgi:hypothetical protein